MVIAGVADDVPHREYSVYDAGKTRKRRHKLGVI